MNKFSFGDLDIYSSVYEYVNSNMFMIVLEQEAVVVDPHVNDDALALLMENGVRKVYVILTHEHPDHISGIWWFLKRFDCTLICSAQCARQISDKRYTRPSLLTLKVQEEDKKNGTDKLAQFKKTFKWTTYNADVTFENELSYSWCGCNFFFKSIGGHSPGSCLIILNNKIVFSGDSLLKEYPVIVSFPQSDKKLFLTETIFILEQKLKPDNVIFPGHGAPFMLRDIMEGDKICVELR